MRDYFEINLYFEIIFFIKQVIFLRKLLISSYLSALKHPILYIGLHVYSVHTTISCLVVFIVSIPGPLYFIHISSFVCYNPMKYHFSFATGISVVPLDSLRCMFNMISGLCCFACICFVNVQV